MLAAGCALTVMHPSFAQSYPGRPIQLVVPFSPGGAVDLLARLVSQRLSEDGKYAIVVENKPGAGGNIAAAQVARAPADGYTLLMGTSNTHGINSYIYGKLPYDPIKDFVPVGMVAENIVVLLAGKAFPAEDLTGAVQAMKEHPGKFVYASPGQGTVHHLAMALLAHGAGLDVVHAPYKGAGPAMTDLVAGHVPLMIGGIAPARPFIESGQVKVLGQANAERFDALPEAQRFDDVAKGASVNSWIGLFAPAGTPPAVVEQLNADLNRVLADAAFQSELAIQGMVAKPTSPSEFGGVIERDMAVWKSAVEMSGARE
ncbi:tripartite tricarboxylate transporter substrate binding protein [Verticiella sediminum]|uniref:Tripartite tricarboxylate transporter substrate binding protein n=2 Tax=Verticiella sediminum TaxID=1247510 RepID=A0A556B2A5_9BURK|nr:tripartite tricarboxylate transporter substrate binding protein [Verticiella sediminum]